MKTKNEEKQEKYFMSIKLIKYDKDENDFFIPLDNKIKIIFLMFLIAFFDSVQFYLSNIELHYLNMLSVSFCTRLFGISTISASFYYVYALKLPVFKHHKISLSIIGICLIIIIITEYFFNSVNYHVTFKRFFTAVGCIMISKIFVSCTDSIEKYLFEYDFINPFVVLMYEGIFGYLLSFFLFLKSNYLEDIRNFIKKNNNNKKKIIGIIFALFFYMITSGGKNIFRVVTNKIYSPMTKTFSDYVLNPIYIIYYYGARHDFIINNKFQHWYFSFNIIISLIISFFGCVYNEFIILFCCQLERDTHDQISKRAESLTKMAELIKLGDESFEDEGIDNSINLQNEKKFS